MPLTPGTHIGPFEIKSPLGAGGMGEVYRAFDARLKRDVAIKVVSPEVASDDSQLRRLSREAEALAALNHANIAHVYGFESGAIVMELVDGEDLAQRIRRGRIDADAALTIAASIAGAMHAAHEARIIHRDLKPANIKVRHDGTIKVLDFGLAKAASPADEGDGAATVTARSVTAPGGVVGTAAYMSPEQAKGKAVDARTDVWALGCILFEMLAGVRAFDGETTSDVLAAVIMREPPWQALPAETAASTRRLLGRMLQKDPERRMRGMADVKLELLESIDDLKTSVEPPTRVSAKLKRTAFVAIGLAIAGAGAMMWSLRGAPPRPAPPRRFAIDLPVENQVTLTEGARPFALSRDGSLLVMSGGSHEGSQLYVRSLASGNERALSGTIAGYNPFFSPDDRWVGFAQGRSLRKVPVGGGPIETICDCLDGGSTSAVWTTAGIYVTEDVAISRGIGRVSDAGVLEPLTTVDSAKEWSHRWPDLLPDGRHLLYTVVDAAQTSSQVVIERLDSQTRHVLMTGVGQARYANGHLLYMQDGSLFAVPFDPRRQVVSGTPTRLIERVETVVSVAQFDLSEDGMLVYVPASRRNQRTLVWVDRGGGRTSLPLKTAEYTHPTLSPDGRHVAIRITEREASDIWINRIGTDTLTRITFSGVVSNPIWTPDGESLVFASREGVDVVLMEQRVDGTAKPTLLFRERSQSGRVGGLWPGSWAPDGQQLTLMVTSGDIGVLRRGRPELLHWVARTASTEWGGRISADGRSVAYVSNESGRWNVYVQSFPVPGGRLQVSADGGSEAVWSRNGRELFFRNGARMMTVQFEGAVNSGVPSTTMMFEGTLVRGQPGLPNYDVAADGRFLMLEPGPEERGRTLSAFLNWPSFIAESVR